MKEQSKTNNEKPDKKKGFNIKVFKNNIFMLRFVWKCTPAYIIGMVIEGVLWGFNNSIHTIYTKMLFDKLGGGASFTEVATVIGYMAAYLAIFYILHYWYWNYFNGVQRQKLNYRMQKELFEKARSLDLSCYDNPDFYNDFVWAIRESDSRAIALVEDIGKLINRVVASITVISILFTIDISIAFIILAFTGIRITLQFILNKIDFKKQQELNPLNRKSSYINRVFHLADYAKELRVSHVKDNILGEYEDNINKIKKISVHYGKKYFFLNCLVRITLDTCDIIVLLIMLYKLMVAKSVLLGGFAAAINARWTMTWLLGDMMNRFIKFPEHSLYIEKVRTFLNYEPRIRSGALPTPAFEKLSLNNVSFGYKDKPVLKNINLEIKKGEKIAIVGYNGAGKTTLIKLLMRLYDVTDGSITYNGHNLREYEVPSFRSHIGAVFQDYKIFAASIAENVIGDEYNDLKQECVLKALDQSTFTDKLEKLKLGIHTELTREFAEEGTVLSGGEAQKIAIARVFAHPYDLIIMDEPSSALDPIAEYELNKRIMEFAENKTVIFISHRLSTTRHADRIYMFADGEIIEQGSHEELMKLQGEYARMFELQAKNYKVKVS